MKPTTEGSIANFDMVCISFDKEKEKRGIKVVQGATKNSIFNEEMMIKVENGELTENNILKSENGNIIKFENNAFKILKRNRKMKAQKGMVYNFEVEKRARNSKKEQERGA